MIGSLSLDQLRVLVTIADAGSFSAAGRKLGRVQSAISQTVATLESIQGVMLFDRSEHRPRLTEIGQVLVEQARMVLASAVRFEAVAAGTRAGLEPELTLAIDPLVPTAPLIDSLRALSEMFPDLPVNFSTEGLGGSLRRLRSGSAALAICVLLPTVPDDIVAYPLLRVAWNLMSSSSCPTRSILAGLPMVLRARGYGASWILAGGWISCSGALDGAECRSISLQNLSLKPS